MQYYLAIDIGASSGRHILGHVADGCMVLEEIYRFENRQLRLNGHDCWDMPWLWEQILQGLIACKTAGKIPVTLGIDTWAVDFVLLDENGTPTCDPVAYRDARTEGVRNALEQTLPFAEHYAKTGIQYQPFNTIYQLLALKNEHPEQLEAAQHLLMIPEYLNFKLTGIMQNEYTNATSTALVNAQKKTWDDALVAQLGLPRHIFGSLAMPGTAVGNFAAEIRQTVGFDCKVILPATHDTASAFLAVPMRDEFAVCLSSGTWSLLGVENAAPITTAASCAENFTNEGGYEYRYRYLKNIMGLWILQSIRRQLNGVSYVAKAENAAQTQAKWSFAQMEDEARKASGFTGRFDVNAEALLAPEDMIQAVKDQCRIAGTDVPQTVGEVVQAVYASLAASYADTIKTLQMLTGKRFTSINIVGGGSKDGYLNQLTAQATGLPVFAGPPEGTALGNIMVQMLQANEYPDLQSARQAIKHSFTIQEVTP